MQIWVDAESDSQVLITRHLTLCFPSFHSNYCFFFSGSNFFSSERSGGLVEDVQYEAECDPLFSCRIYLEKEKSRHSPLAFVVFLSRCNCSVVEKEIVLLLSCDLSKKLT